MRPFGLIRGFPSGTPPPIVTQLWDAKKGGASAPHFHQLTTSKGRVTDEELGGSKTILVSR